jgi:hypothetical protein
MMASIVYVKQKLKTIHDQLRQSFYDEDDYEPKRESKYFESEYGLEFLTVFPGVKCFEQFKGQTMFMRSNDFIQKLRTQKDFFTVYDPYFSSKKASEIIDQRGHENEVLLFFDIF